MAELSKINVSGIDYGLKDELARNGFYDTRLASLRDMGNLHGDGSVLIYPALGTIDYPEGAEPNWEGALETSTYFNYYDMYGMENKIIAGTDKAVVFAIPRGYTYLVGQDVSQTCKIRHIIVPNTITKIETGDPIFFFDGSNIDFVPSIDLSDFTDGKPFPTYSASFGGLTHTVPTWSEDADPDGLPDGEKLIPCTIYVAKGRKAELAAMTAWCDYADYMVEV